MFSVKRSFEQRKFERNSIKSFSGQDKDKDLQGLPLYWWCVCKERGAYFFLPQFLCFMEFGLTDPTVWRAGERKGFVRIILAFRLSVQIMWSGCKLARVRRMTLNLTEQISYGVSLRFSILFNSKPLDFPTYALKQRSQCALWLRIWFKLQKQLLNWQSMRFFVCEKLLKFKESKHQLNISSFNLMVNHLNQFKLNRFLGSLALGQLIVKMSNQLNFWIKSISPVRKQNAYRLPRNGAKDTRTKRV